MIKKVLYLGPAGSYSEIAKEKFINYFGLSCEAMPVSSIYKIVRILRHTDDSSVAAVIPIENSVEGIVRDTQDNLALLAENHIKIQAETSIAIEHSLVSFVEKAQIKVITSHPQALAQCREYIYNNWGDDIILNPVLSTSAAVSSLCATSPEIAAIGSEHCANLYNLSVLEKCINDEKNNTTRFLFLSKIQPSKTDINKVSLKFSTVNEVGALNKVLSIFERYGINLSYIDSRPSKKELGEYVFYVDFMGHINDSNISLACVEIQPFVKKFEILSDGAICV